MPRNRKVAKITESDFVPFIKAVEAPYIFEKLIKRLASQHWGQRASMNKLRVDIDREADFTVRSNDRPHRVASKQLKLFSFGGWLSSKKGLAGARLPKLRMNKEWRLDHETQKSYRDIVISGRPNGVVELDILLERLKGHLRPDQEDVVRRFRRSHRQHQDGSAVVLNDNNGSLHLKAQLAHQLLAVLVILGLVLAEV